VNLLRYRRGRRATAGWLVAGMLVNLASSFAYQSLREPMRRRRQWGAIQHRLFFMLAGALPQYRLAWKAMPETARAPRQLQPAALRRRRARRRLLLYLYDHRGARRASFSQPWR
jgi:hypothetical protein